MVFVKLFAFICLYLSILPQSDSQYSFGDIRLFLNGSTDTDNVQGVVEVFINGQWGTICKSKFNIASAAAACRQLGFQTALSFNTPRELNLQYPPDVLPVLTNVECNDYNPDELSTSGSLHILRCPNNIIDNDDKTCASSISIVAVQCDSKLLSDNPYQGQIRLINGESTSSGLVQIYIHDAWGTICIDNLSESGADSICRQLGYTNAESFKPTSSSIDVPVWIDRTYCTQSSECFSTQCIKYPGPNGVSSGACANHSRDTFINCSYDILNDGNPSSGNIYECKISHENTNTALVLGVSLGILIPLFLASCILACTVVTCCCISTCPLYAYRNKWKYASASYHEGLI